MSIVLSHADVAKRTPSLEPKRVPRRQQHAPPRQARRVKNRAREIRESQGYTLEDVAQLVANAFPEDRGDTVPKTIQRLEVGERRLSDYWIEILSKVYNVRPEEFFAKEPGRCEVPIVGYVGADEVVLPFHNGGKPAPVVAPADAANAVVVVVRGDALWPSYRPGDLLFYEPVDAVDMRDCADMDCVVHAADGATYIKRLLAGSGPGLYHLLSDRSSPLYDVQVSWASPITWVKRGRR